MEVKAALQNLVQRGRRSAFGKMQHMKVHVISAFVCLRTVPMCILAQWIAIGRLLAADPAPLY
jgi:hypothetical protein